MKKEQNNLHSNFADEENKNSDITAETKEETKDSEVTAKTKGSKNVNNTKKRKSARNSLESSQKKEIKEAEEIRNKKSKIKGTIFLVSFLSCCVLAIILGFSRQIVWAGIFVGVGMAMVLIAICVVSNKERKAMANSLFYEENIDKALENNFIQAKAVVTTAFIHKQNYVGKTNRQNKSKGVYKVVVKLGGVEFVAYSRYFFKKGEVVDIVYKADSEYASLVVQMDDLK